MMAPQTSRSAVMKAESCAPDLALFSPNVGPTEALSLVTAPVKGVNGDEAEQSKAAKRLQALAPLIYPDRFPELHKRFPRIGDLEAYLAEQNGTSIWTIRRDKKRFEEEGINGLTRKIRADKGVPVKVNRAAQEFILRSVLPKFGCEGRLSVADGFRYYQEERAWRASQAGKLLALPRQEEYRHYIDAEGHLRPDAQLPEISLTTYRNVVDWIPEPIKAMARDGEDAFRNAEIISYRDLGSLQPMEYVVMDHRVLDVFCLAMDATSKSGWRLIRPWLTAAIDMRTRKWLAWVVVETPSSDSIAAVLRRVFLEHGLPVNVYWDNGKDFRCEWLEGGRAAHEIRPVVGELDTTWRGVLGTLDVRVVHAIPYRARSKVIEPNFGRISKFDRTLPWWCGHRPEFRPEQLELLVKQHEKWIAGEIQDAVFPTIGQIADLYDRAIADLNERDLEGEGMRTVKVPSGYRWMCPNEAWEKLIGQVPRRTAPAEVIQACFRKRRELTVRNGAISVTFGGQSFHYRLADNSVKLLLYNGRKVELAYDPLDLEDAAVYFDKEFLGIARCVQLRKMGEDAFVQDERDRRAARREVKRFISAVHQTVPVPDAETQLSRRRAVAPVRTAAERPEVLVPIPEGIMAAAAAREAERAYSLESSACELKVEKLPARDDCGDDEFNFFSDQGAEANG